MHGITYDELGQHSTNIQQKEQRMKVCLQEGNRTIRELISNTLITRGHEVLIADMENPAWKILTNNQDIKLALIDGDVEYLYTLQALKDMRQAGRKFISFLYGSIPMQDALQLMGDSGTKVIFKSEIVRCLQQEGVI